MRCGEAELEFQGDAGAFVLLQLENTRVLKVATASLHNYWWGPIAYVVLFTAAFMLLHGWLFRPHKSVFLLLAPLSIAAVPLYGHADVAEIPTGEVGFFVAKMIGLIIPVQLAAALCVADAEDARPLPAFVHRTCVYYLKGRQWPFLLFYLILLLNILDAVISDMARQNYLNAVTGLCLMLTIPFPGPGIQYPLGESDMAAMQTELQGREVTDEELKAHASEWYVARTNVNGRQMSDVCANLDFLWIKLYTSWNLLFMLSMAPEHMNENNWAILIVPLLENARIRYVIASQGVKLNAWTSSHWLQVRAFSLWLYLIIRLTPQFQALVEMNPKSFFQVANTEANRQSWGIFNMVWALLHLCWLVLSPYLTKK